MWNTNLINIFIQWRTFILHCKSVTPFPFHLLPQECEQTRQRKAPQHKSNQFALSLWFPIPLYQFPHLLTFWTRHSEETEPFCLFFQLKIQTNIYFEYFFSFDFVESYYHRIWGNLRSSVLSPMQIKKKSPFNRSTTSFFAVLRFFHPIRVLGFRSFTEYWLGSVLLPRTGFIIFFGIGLIMTLNFVCLFFDLFLRFWVYFK